MTLTHHRQGVHWRQVPRPRRRPHQGHVSAAAPHCALSTLIAPLRIYRIVTETRGTLGKLVDFDFDSYRTPTEVDAWVNEETLAAVEKAGFKAEKIVNQAEEYMAWLKANSPKENRLLDYHDYEELTAYMQDYANRYPNITNLFSIGQTVAGRELWVMEISDNPGQTELGEPEFKYVGNMHGDETVGRELLVNLIGHVLDNYGTDARITRLVDNTRTWILPSMNHDGSVFLLISALHFFPSSSLLTSALTLPLFFFPFSK